MKRILKSELDKFYTKQDVAKYLIDKVNIDYYDLVVDPSCGDGSFYSNIHCDNKIGIDIESNLDGIIIHDFLTWNSSSLNVDSSKVLVISNPPFGKQGSLAMKFIKKSSEFADTIAFILPLSFAKDSVKNRIPNFYHLEYEEILNENSFLLNGEDYDVKCVFQIWKKRNYIRKKSPLIIEKGFSYTKNKSLADLSIRRVGIYAGQAFLDTDKSEQSHYFIILDNKDKLTDVMDFLNNLEWIDLTVGPRSISKQELNKKINSLLV